MKKIAILGCENSHADAFLKCIKEKEEFGEIEVVGIYSDEREAAEKLREQFGVTILEDYADAVGKVDGIMITARHGDNHFKYAKPYIESGIPMYIDKPITNGEEEAVTFMEQLKAHGIRISGGSSLKKDEFVMRLKADRESDEGGKTLGGYVRAPYEKDSEYGGLFFYAQHLVEMEGEIFGRYPISVWAKPNGDQIHVLFHYEEYDCVGLFCNEKYKYFASRMSEKTSDAYMIPTSSAKDWFYREFKEFCGLLDGEPQELSYEDFIAPVFVMSAIARSLESGKEERVNSFEIGGEK